MLDNEIDNVADEEIRACLDLENPKSFFLYAGAGSGKTRSLVNALKHIRSNYGDTLWLQGRRIGVITYTNAASDEIKNRTKFDTLIDVSTIHSFLWSLIRGYNHDIRKWLCTNLQREIEILKQAQAKGRASKTSERRARSIISKMERLARLDEIRVFTYSPDGENRSRDSLNHAEVISMGTAFIIEKPTLGRLLLNKYPILLIDESQDTNKHLIDALFKLQAEHPEEFSLGLFGDTMQRIYADGKSGLTELIPDSWAKPVKKMNHRCRERIVKLINQIRSQVDDQTQQSRTDKAGGFVRLFIAPLDQGDKAVTERNVALRMSEITGDKDWKEVNKIKILALEHLMSARRLGFMELFAPLYAIDSLKTGLLAGTLPGLRFFTHRVLPLVAAKQRNDDFAVAAMLRKYSPLLHSSALKHAGMEQIKQLQRARKSLAMLLTLWDNDKTPTCRSILSLIGNSGLLEIPEALKPFVETDRNNNEITDILNILPAENEEEFELNTILQAWDTCLDAPVSQVPHYLEYVEGRSSFDTHQGIKGLEFPRVMVIVDDNEARGFTFSYDKLLGVKAKSKADTDHETAGEETMIDRTRRLFYVTCSRAEESLAVVFYSASPPIVRQNVINAGWFETEEVELII